MAAKTNPIYKTKNRASGAEIHLHDMSLDDGYEVGDDKWHIRCALHDEIAVFKKQADAYKAMTRPVWCTGCVAIMEGKGEKREAAKEGFQAYAKVVTKELLEEGRASPPLVEEGSVLTNHQKMMQNICTSCGGPLKAQDGHYHEMGRPLAAVCCSCRGHVIANVNEDQPRES